jgi:hypothetical protein
VRNGPASKLVAHVGLLLVLLLAQRAVLDLGHGSFSSDEGAYALQVFAIGDGRWDIDDPFLDDGTDPPTTAFPNFTVQDGVVHPYVQHPAWPRLLAVADDLAGTTGAYAFTLLAGLAVPLLAWWAVGRLAPDAAGGWTPVVAFWAAALAPAALVSSSILWAHAPSAALAGVAVVLGVDRRRGLDLALAAAAVAGGVLLRSEGILVGLAIGAVLVGRGARRRDPGELLAAAVIGAAAGVALVLERVWQDAILGGPLEAAGVRGESTGRGFLVDRFDGVLHSLVGSRYELDGSVLFLGGLVVLAAAIAALGVDSGDGRRAAVGSWVAVGCLALVWLLRPDLPYTGLLVVWPVAVAGAVGLGVLPPPARSALSVVTLFALGVALTIYPGGGGVEWGGRFFSPVTVPLAVGFAVLVDRGRALAPEARRATTGALAVAALVVAGFATTATRGARDGGAEVEEAVLASGATVALTPNGLLPSIAWRTHPEVSWIIVGEGAPARSVDAALRAALDAGVDRIVAVGVPVEDLERAGLEVERTQGRLTVGRITEEVGS